MANRKTRRARKGSPKNNVAPSSCQREYTIGTGAGRGFGLRDEAPIYKGTACNTARRNGKSPWVGALEASKRSGGGY